jgi:NAD(P)-dependent dehydrogenase (short-subunit alcohol dehydrogenase family)
VIGDGVLTGRVALVTGAGRGIGRAIANRLAADGATVVLAGRSVEALEAACEEIARAGGRCAVVPVDVREEESVAELALLAREQCGPVDLLVANSGIAGPTDELWRLSLEDWQETLRVNLTGVFLVCRALAPAMVTRRSGSIVVIGSSTGKNPLPRRTPYAASKTGLVGLVRALAWELGPHGVRVNLVSPGATDGERLDAVIARQADGGGRSPEVVRAALIESSPLARLTSAQDVAAVVAFLAGDGAAAITGEDVNVSMGSVMHG